MDPEYGSPVRPMDHFRAVGYPDDPEVINNSTSLALPCALLGSLER